MRVLILILIFLAAPAFGHEYLERRIAQEQESFRGLVSERAQLIEEEGKLRARLEKLPGGNAEAAEVEKAMVTHRATIEAFNAIEPQIRDRLHTLWHRLLGSAQAQVLATLEKDKRRPTRLNLSGVWCSAPNLTGFTFQLEQRGENITGQGYRWGCEMNIYPFTVTGLYRGRFLSLKFTEDSAHTWTRAFKPYIRKNQPAFRSADSKSKERIFRWCDMDYK